MKYLLLFVLLLSILEENNVQAADSTISAKVPNQYQLLVLAKSDGSAAKSTAGGAVNVQVSAGNQGRLYLVSKSTGELGANIILAIKKGGKTYSWKEAKAQKVCRGKARAVYGFKVKGTKLNVGAVKVKSGWGYLSKNLTKGALDTTAIGTITSKCEPTATAATLGIGSTTSSGVESSKRIHIRADSDDTDGDGLANVLDADDDNDGTLDPYDADTSTTNPPSGTLPSEVRLFSNIKPEITQSLNAYTETITDSRIDTLVSRSNLAIQVAGGSSLATELDCGALAYCSSGGTGTNMNQPFPDNFDSDGDGKGTITPGGTGDFQLTTGASKSSIGGGDILIEEVDNGDGTTTSIPGMLNFIFNTTPAIASVSMGSMTFTPSYPASEGMMGSANNPFIAPSGWDQKLSVTAYRPQRPGISGVGEADLVDIGNSKIGIDIPNNPCTVSGGGGCPGQNTSRCGASSYTESDSNLSIEGEGLKDGRADQDTDTTNPTTNQITFTVDLSTCISETWDSGEKLGIDLQFSNNVGDNAAQKFYVQLP